MVMYIISMNVNNGKLPRTGKCLEAANGEQTEPWTYLFSSGARLVLDLRI